MSNDRRLIEDFLPIQAISAEASREKSVRKGHISTLHLWWARRPLVACRAAVYGALVSASQFVPKEAPDNKKQSLGRANAAKFVERLCKYPGNPAVIKEAEQHILKAHAERLTLETGQRVTVKDIEEGRAPRPKVLDMFAGGGAIPLEALRLGCEAYALDLNPVAHIIELCTLVYPQKYGKPDSDARGMTGPKNEKGQTTWGGLAEEVRYWGNWVLEKVKAEIGDLYPPIPDPEAASIRQELGNSQLEMSGKGFERRGQQKFAVETPVGYLTPVAYLWTRTVRCKNPSCGATVPLVKQTWLRKKKGNYAALRVSTDSSNKVVRFEVVESSTEAGLGFDPTGFSTRGNATCPFCSTVADIDYIKDEGWMGRMSTQLMAVACVSPQTPRSKTYVSPDHISGIRPDQDRLNERVARLCKSYGLSLPQEQIADMNADSRKNSLGITVRPYGIREFGDLFHPRQLACLLAFTGEIRAAEAQMSSYPQQQRVAILTFLACLLDRLADFSSTVCVWNSLEGERTAHTFGRHAISMTWDFAEADPFNPANAGWPTAMERIIPAVESVDFRNEGIVVRGSATSIFLPDKFVDAIITDPPYYDNIPYADISDFFYIWLKRSIGHLYPEHFTSNLTPKKSEAIADAGRHNGSWDRAREAYEQMMTEGFAQAYRCLRSQGSMAIVYAHKTTLGWASLVDALRRAGFIITEAWPLDTEKPGRLRAQASAALASSIFLVARKREGSVTGSYEDDVRPELEKIVRERVDSLWKMGITGADLVIAAVGAGLRAFTRFSRVEYANGEEVPAEKFLAEVEGVVLETLLEKIIGVTGSGVAAVDGPSRFYVLWRYTYKAAEMDAGEAIVFTYGQNVELDGQNGLTAGNRALAEKKKGKYRLRDFTERGDNERLGMPEAHTGKPAPLIDALHRILWLVENQPRHLPRFLDEARPDRERLRLVAQALAGTALEGRKDSGPEQLAVLPKTRQAGLPARSAQAGVVMTTPAEQAALKKLVANWRALIESRLAGPGPLFEEINN